MSTMTLDRRKFLAISAASIAATVLAASPAAATTAGNASKASVDTGVGLEAWLIGTGWEHVDSGAGSLK